MASTIWRLQGIDTQGNDLVLRRIVPWASSGELVPLSITSRFAPTSGVLANLLLDDASECVFAAADVYKPGFAIEFTFATPVDLWGFRFAGPSAATWPTAHIASDTTLAASLPSVQFSGAGVLSGAPTQPLRMGVAINEWTPLVAAGSRSWVRCAVSANGQVMLASAYTNGNLWLSKDGGTTWVAQTAAGSRNWYGCAVSADGQVLLASAYGGSLWLSKDGGSTWTAQATPGTRNWSGCSMSADGQVLLAPAYTNGSLWLSKDGGTTWAAQAAPGARNWYGSAVSANGQVLLATAAGANLWLSKDGGTTWVAQTAAGTRNWYECDASADGQVLMATIYSGELPWLSKDGGTTWAAQTAAGVRDWQGCAVSGNGQVLLIGANGSLALSKDSGATWVSQPVPGSLLWNECALSDDGLTMLAVPATGEMYLFVAVGAPYQDRPLRTLATRSAAVLKGAAPEPQGTLRTKSSAATQVSDTEYGGQGRVHGTVERKNTPTNVPLRRRVRLHRSRDGLLVRETWSKADGTYEFNGVSMQYEYDAIAWDNEMSYRSVIANNLKPEAM